MILVPDEGSPQPMTRIHDEGLFVFRSQKRADPFAYRLTVTRERVSWTTRDPYCYLPQLGEMDLHLFSEGRHLNLHRIMGARVRTIGDIPGVLFAVWAPNARAVSVVGSFNDWDRRRHPMRTRGVSGVWELFVPGVTAGDLYKFSMLDANGFELVKADPYALRSEMRPGTASIVADPGSYQWGDGGWIEKRGRANPFSARISIYEAHAMSWAAGEERYPGWEKLGDWLIPYLGQMGFTHIELMPVMEHPYDGSWGYQVTGFFAPTSRMGSPEDFCRFVDRCHQNGIGVILDWTPAHFPMDDWALARFDGTHLYEHEDPRLGLHPDWGTLIFNYGRREVRNFLLASAIHWLDTFHIDGLRVDAVASLLYLDYSRKEGQWIPNRYGGRENLEAASLLREICHETGCRFPGALTGGRGEHRMARGNPSAGSGRAGFSFQVEHGLDERHARILQPRSALQEGPLGRYHFQRGVRVERELHTAPLTRRGGSRQGLAVRQDAGGRLSKKGQPQASVLIPVAVSGQAASLHGGRKGSAARMEPRRAPSHGRHQYGKVRGRPEHPSDGSPAASPRRLPVFGLQVGGLLRRGFLGHLVPPPGQRALPPSLRVQHDACSQGSVPHRCTGRRKLGGCSQQ